MCRRAFSHRTDAGHPANRQDALDGSTPPEKYKTLYLLHGLLGNYTDWVSGTRIQRWAEEHDLAVVMPSGDNAFYVDQPEANNRYGEFIGKALVELTRKMFPLSDRREDTFIGGLSMGGFGAKKRENPATELPKIFLACGTEDGLIKHSRTYRNLLRENGFDVTYEEAPGSHNRDFWDTFIKTGCRWTGAAPASTAATSAESNASVIPVS